LCIWQFHNFFRSRSSRPMPRLPPDSAEIVLSLPYLSSSLPLTLPSHSLHLLFLYYIRPLLFTFDSFLLPYIWWSFPNGAQQKHDP
jgi:hypothetical protein